MKKNTSTPRPHPAQEKKTDHAPTAKVRADANKNREDNVNMPRGAESDYKEELLESKEARQRRLTKNPKQ